MRNTIVLLALISIPVVAFGCPKGFIEYAGTCAYDPAPAESASANTGKWVSDEKPPKTTTGEWQDGKTQIVTLKPESTVDDEIAAANKWDNAHGQPHRGVTK